MAYSLKYPFGISALIAVVTLLLALYVAVPVTQVVATRINDTVADQVIGSASQTTKFLSKALAIAAGVTVVAAIIPSPVQPIAWVILGSSALGVATGAATAAGAACVGWGPCG